MIGADDHERISRQTSMPGISGSPRSSTIERRALGRGEIDRVAAGRRLRSRERCRSARAHCGRRAGSAARRRRRAQRLSAMRRSLRGRTMLDPNRQRKEVRSAFSAPCIVNYHPPRLRPRTPHNPRRPWPARRLIPRRNCSISCTANRRISPRRPAQFRAADIAEALSRLNRKRPHAS